MIGKPSKVSKIKLYYNNAAYWNGATHTCGFEFLSKEGRTFLLVGDSAGYTTKVFEVEENEQVIGIKALTVTAPAHVNHGSLVNLQFKIAKVI
jgi:hypothetical protein